MQHGCLTPDLTFYLDVTLETAMERIPKKVGEREEIYEKKEILEKVLKGYDWLIKEFPDEFQVLNAGESIDEVSKNMIQRIEEFHKKL